MSESKSGYIPPEANQTKKYEQSGISKDPLKDASIQALAPGWRKSINGNWYFENRKNRSDTDEEWEEGSKPTPRKTPILDLLAKSTYVVLTRSHFEIKRDSLKSRWNFLYRGSIMENKSNLSSDEVSDIILNRYLKSTENSQEGEIEFYNGEELVGTYPPKAKEPRIRYKFEPGTEYISQYGHPYSIISRTEKSIHFKEIKRNEERKAVIKVLRGIEYFNTNSRWSDDVVYANRINKNSVYPEKVDRNTPASDDKDPVDPNEIYSDEKYLYTYIKILKKYDWSLTEGHEGEYTIIRSMKPIDEIDEWKEEYPKFIDNWEPDRFVFRNSKSEIIDYLHEWVKSAGLLKVEPDEDEDEDDIENETEDETKKQLPRIETSPIDEDLARRAHDSYSFSDYRKGSATNEYNEAMRSAEEKVEAHKQKVDPIYHEKINAMFERYKSMYAKNINDINSNDARLPSSFITGGSNYPMGKWRKQQARRDTLMNQYQEIQSYLDKILTVGNGGIQSGDKDAITKLEIKLKNLEELQEQMKKGNAYYKKNGTLEGSGLPDSLIKEGYSTIKGWNGVYGSPFPPYALSNNNAKIRSTRERIEQLSKEKSKPKTNKEFEWGSVVRNTEDMRLQLLFNSIHPPPCTHMTIGGFTTSSGTIKSRYNPWVSTSLNSMLSYL